MWYYTILQILVTLLAFINLSTSNENDHFRTRRRILNLRSDPSVQNSYKYKIKYLEVPVDHFNFDNSDTFKIRYLINDEYWSPETGAPIFFYTGNEGDIEMFANNTGFLWETAPEFKALIVFAEHRYYGKSLPYGNKTFTAKRNERIGQQQMVFVCSKGCSVMNYSKQEYVLYVETNDRKESFFIVHREQPHTPNYWGYLTAEQAMADYIDLIAYLRSHQKYGHRVGKRSPVIAFGGSYGGMLAAWIRMKYPDSIAGSLAASAPIFMFTGLTDCSVFYKITTSAYKLGSHHCPDNVRQTWRELNKLVAKDDGRKWLSKEWSLCKELKSPDDGYALKDWLADKMIDVAMANYPYPANFLGELPAHPVKKFCNHLSTSNLQGKELLGSVYEGLKEWFNYTGKATCLDYSSADPPTLGILGWDYQSCTQMVMPICSEGPNDMFEPSSWNLTEVMDECETQLKRKPRPYFIIKQYGGKHIKTASNIIFSNGLLDPWSGGGLMKNVSKSTYAVLIPEGAHHLDLRESNQLDPMSVVNARNTYKQIFRKWIKEYSKNVFNV